MDKAILVLAGIGILVIALWWFFGRNASQQQQGGQAPFISNQNNIANIIGGGSTGAIGGTSGGSSGQNNIATRLAQGLSQGLLGPLPSYLVGHLPQVQNALAKFGQTVLRDISGVGPITTIVKGIESVWPPHVGLPNFNIPKTNVLGVIGKDVSSFSNNIATRLSKLASQVSPPNIAKEITGFFRGA